LNSRQDLFTPEIREYLQEHISRAQGQEVFFRASYDFADQELNSIKVAARGNETMAPAIVNNLKPGDCVIHNHPSGDLRPSAADIRLASRLGNRGIGFIIIDNTASESYTVVEPEEANSFKPLPEDEIVKILSSGGSLSRIMDNFTEREEQLQVLRRIIAAFDKNDTVFIEAGTGTGKSFAYLLPALYWSKINSGPVVISTNTINLQQQLIEKDLLTLKRALTFDFTATLVRGRNNYLCRRKLKNVLAQQDKLKKEKKDFLRVAEYLQDQVNSENFTGVKSDISFTINSDYWQEVSSESDLCLNSFCPYFSDCYFHRERKEIHQSDILIVNHHLLLADAVLKNNRYSVLPDYRKLIIDESHNLPDVATQISGLDFYPPALIKTIERLKTSPNSPLVRLRNNSYEIDFPHRSQILELLDQKIWPLLQQLIEAGKNYQQELEELLQQNQDTKIRLEEDTFSQQELLDWQNSGENLLSLLASLEIYLKDIAELLQDGEEDALQNEGEEPYFEIRGLLSRISEFGEALNLNLNFRDHQSNYVFWLESLKNYNNVSQKNGMLEINDFLQEILFSRMSTTVLTSATLAIDGSFSYYRKRLGLSQADSLLVKSPFDYASQVKIYAPREIPVTAARDFIPEVEGKIAKYLAGRGGSALVLFTSYAMLRELKAEIQSGLQSRGYQILAQGEEPRTRILNKLRRQQGTILLGTSSFWEGIDVPGEALSSLIIMKLPFAVPSDPLVAARSELLADRGQNPFWEESLPQAVIKFKQGFGRLIRDKNDRGEVLILDKRLWTKSYGRIFINSLPEGCEILKSWPDLN